jgi:ATP-dependent DNA helicase RecG
MAETSDDCGIAKADLEMRGPGECLGRKQSELPEVEVVEIVEDQWILEHAKSEAWKLMTDDPDLEKTEHQELKNVFLPYYKEKSKFYGMG